MPITTSQQLIDEIDAGRLSEEQLVTILKTNSNRYAPFRQLIGIHGDGARDSARVTLILRQDQVIKRAAANKLLEMRIDAFIASYKALTATPEQRSFMTFLAEGNKTAEQIRARDEYSNALKIEDLTLERGAVSFRLADASIDRHIAANAKLNPVPPVDPDAELAANVQNFIDTFPDPSSPEQRALIKFLSEGDKTADQIRDHANFDQLGSDIALVGAATANIDKSDAAKAKCSEILDAKVQNFIDTFPDAPSAQQMALIAFLAEGNKSPNQIRTHPNFDQLGSNIVIAGAANADIDQSPAAKGQLHKLLQAKITAFIDSTRVSDEEKINLLVKLAGNAAGFKPSDIARLTPAELDLIGISADLITLAAGHKDDALTTLRDAAKVQLQILVVEKIGEISIDDAKLKALNAILEGNPANVVNVKDIGLDDGRKAIDVLGIEGAHLDALGDGKMADLLQALSQKAVQTIIANAIVEIKNPSELMDILSQLGDKDSITKPQFLAAMQKVSPTFEGGKNAAILDKYFDNNSLAKTEIKTKFVEAYIKAKVASMSFADIKDLETKLKSALAVDRQAVIIKELELTSVVPANSAAVDVAQTQGLIAIARQKYQTGHSKAMADIIHQARDFQLKMTSDLPGFEVGEHRQKMATIFSANSGLDASTKNATPIEMVRTAIIARLAEDPRFKDRLAPFTPDREAREAGKPVKYDRTKALTDVLSEIASELLTDDPLYSIFKDDAEIEAFLTSDSPSVTFDYTGSSVQISNYAQALAIADHIYGEDTELASNAALHIATLLQATPPTLNQAEIDSLFNPSATNIPSLPGVITRLTSALATKDPTQGFDANPAKLMDNVVRRNFAKELLGDPNRSSEIKPLFTASATTPNAELNTLIDILAQKKGEAANEYVAGTREEKGWIYGKNTIQTHELSASILKGGTNPFTTPDVLTEVQEKVLRARQIKAIIDEKTATKAQKTEGGWSKHTKAYMDACKYFEDEANTDKQQGDAYISLAKKLTVHTGADRKKYQGLSGTVLSDYLKSFPPGKPIKDNLKRQHFNSFISNLATHLSELGSVIHASRKKIEEIDTKLLDIAQLLQAKDCPNVVKEYAKTLKETKAKLENEVNGELQSRYAEILDVYSQYNPKDAERVAKYQIEVPVDTNTHTFDAMEAGALTEAKVQELLGTDQFEKGGPAVAISAEDTTKKWVDADSRSQVVASVVRYDVAKPTDKKAHTKVTNPAVPETSERRYLKVQAADGSKISIEGISRLKAKSSAKEIEAEPSMAELRKMAQDILTQYIENKGVPSANNKLFLSGSNTRLQAAIYLEAEKMASKKTGKFWGGDQILKGFDMSGVIASQSVLELARNSNFKQEYKNAKPDTKIKQQVKASVERQTERQTEREEHNSGLNQQQAWKAKLQDVKTTSEQDSTIQSSPVPTRSPGSRS